MCCSGPKWKREVVPDHKFDFIDVREFHDPGCFTRLRYGLVYIFVLKSFLVYVSDLYTAIAMLASNRWAGNILSQESVSDSKTVQIPFSIGKWIFTGCIIFSFLLLAWESRKARSIIRSRDISYSYTNVMANNYYSMKSFDHFCFFCNINNSRKKKDEFAFFVFFTFKGWKRLLLADAPRQAINGLTLYSFGKAYNFTTNVSTYTDGSLIRAGVLVTMIFTVVVWVGSFILLCIAAVMYVPLLCYIRGNLKEYCCHKVDKRIAELMKKRTKKRLLKEAVLARKEAAGDFSHLKDKKGNIQAKPMAQPTLPRIDLDDDDYRSDLSFRKDRKDATYFNQPGHSAAPSYGYPPQPSLPQQSQWSSYPNEKGQGTYPGYAGSDIGGGMYAGSVHSLDRYAQQPQQEAYFPYQNQYEQAPAYVGQNGKAPSYRSQASVPDLREKNWQDDPAAPPTPALPDSYTYSQQQQQRQDYQHDSHYGSENQFSQFHQPAAYQAPSRQNLFQQTQQQIHRRSNSHTSQASYGQQRPESEHIDFGQYYRETSEERLDTYRR